MKNSKITNFILEISQVFLVFLGVYSAIMCAAMSLSLPVNRVVSTLVVLGASFLFYGLFTVLETFRHGKAYGLAGISVFTLFVVLWFRSALQKGAVTIINTYLKAFMSYTQSEVTLLSGRGFEQETASVGYCTTLVVIVVAVYLTAVISSCFYRKRRSSVFMAATILFFFVPVTVGKIGYFSNVVVYIFTSIAIIGTRFLRLDTTDKRMRQKLSLVLAGVGVVAGVVTWFFITPERYANNLNDIVEIKNSAIAFTTWEREDFLTWVREYFSGDALEYGRIGKKNRVNRSGRVLLKISGDFDKNHGIYFKGYTGADYTENRWRQIRDEDGSYTDSRDSMSLDGLSIESWHVTLRNQIGDSQTTGNENLWTTGKMTIKNLAFGYGNYAVPYYPSVAFSSEAGKSTVAVPGVQYTVEYFPVLFTEIKNGVVSNHYNLADNDYWVNSDRSRARLTEFVKKYYLKTPDETAGIIEEYKAYLNAQGNLLDKFQKGEASLYEIIEETRNFIMMDTEYTLSPGKTPRDKEAVTYFLSENKKGYSSHYATAAAILLRGIGVPTRYVEGLYVSKEKLADVKGRTTEIEVTDKDIHAWPEVYQENYGFVPVEFTPGRGEEDSEQSSVAEEEPENTGGAGGGSQAGDGAHPEQPPVQQPTPEPEDDMTFENIDTDNYNHEEETAEPESESEASGKEKKAKEKKEEEESRLVWWKIVLFVAAALVMFIVVAEAQRRIRIIVFHQNLKKKTMRKQIIAYYRQLERAFLHKGIRYHGQSVSEYTEQIAGAYGMEADVIAPFVAMVYCASFSYHKFDRAQMAEYRTLYRSIRHRIYAEVRGMKKLYYMYILCI